MSAASECRSDVDEAWPLFNDQAAAFMTRFDGEGEIEDLEKAIELYRKALALCSPDDPHRFILLSDLADAVFNRFEEGEEIVHLSEAIELYRNAFALCPPDHPSRSISLSNLANAVLQRFEQVGEIADVDEVIVLYRNALALRPPGHPDRSDSLSDLANAVLTRFEQAGAIADLDEAVELFQNTLVLRQPGHPDRSESLSKLANAVLTRFEQTGSIADLDEAVELNRNALALCPPGNQARFMSLSHLASAVLTRFEQSGAIADLDEALELNRDALALCPPGNSDRSMSSSHLADALMTRFEHGGAIADLDEAIDLNRKSFALFPPSHRNRFNALNNLADAVLTRFEQVGNIADFDEALELNRNALALCPPGNPDRFKSLSNLAKALITRFDHARLIADLDEAMELYRNALALLQPDHPDRPRLLGNLASVLLTRFDQAGAIADLDEAIVLNQNANALHQPGHPDRSRSLGNLANVLFTRFEKAGLIVDLDEVIELYRNALELCPPGHPDRSMWLSNLANAVLTRFEQLEGIADLDEAIALYRNALELFPPGHPDRSMSLNDLASTVMKQFERTGDTSYLVEVSKLLSDAQNSSSVHSPDLGRSWILFANYHIYQYKIDSDKNHVETAFAHFRHAAEYESTCVKERLIAALCWASAAQKLHHESLISAYSTALDLLTRYVVASPSVERQLKLLSTSVEISQSLGLDAAACAIEVGQLKTAVEFLEQGRTLLWTEVRRFRHPIEDLRRTDPELASEFETISRRLELLALSAENTPVTLADPRNNPQIIRGHRVIPKKTRLSLSHTPEVYDAKIREQRKLSEQWDAVVERIRLVDGFPHFLKSVPFSTLQNAAADGPVVVVNISEYRCDAIILRESGDPILVPLPKATPEILRTLYTMFRDARSRFPHNKYFSDELCKDLGKLWKIVVGPVVDELGKIGLEKGSRIWWCPTSYLCGMPLHAAGPFIPYEKDRSVPDHMWLPDLYVSSYTSTLSVLASARSNKDSKIGAPSLLVVAQPSNYLTYINEEISRIKKLDTIVETMVGQEATRETVLKRLPDHPFVHFACHGSSPDSFHSSFALWNNDRLELLDLIKAKMTNAQHAFLSSCHGAGTDIQGNPDEMISLAVALQFCGYRGVVGTLWEMKDADGPEIAEDFYGFMFRHGVDGKTDVEDSARALNMAIQKMKKRRGLIGQWINFIHIGI